MNIYPNPEKATEKVFVVAHCGVGPTGEHYLDMHKKHLAGTTGIREMTAKDMPILQDVADISRSMGKDINVEQVFDELNTCKAGAIVEPERDPQYPSPFLEKGKLTSDVQVLAYRALASMRAEYPAVFSEEGRLQGPLSGATVDIGIGAGISTDRVEAALMAILKTEEGNSRGDVFSLKGITRKYLYEMLGNMLPARIADTIGAMGANTMSNSACSSAGLSWYNAFNAIQSGATHAAMAGGVEVATSNILTYSTFDNIMSAKRGGALDRKWRNHRSAEHALSAYGADRGGFVPGDYAGMSLLVHERMVDALQLEPLAEVLAVHANRCDIAHYAASESDGTVLGQSALHSQLAARAGISSWRDSPVMMLAHGTGTVAGGQNEIASAAVTFGEHDDFHLSGQKEFHGHSLGAAFADNISGILASISLGQMHGLPVDSAIDPALLEPEAVISSKEKGIVSLTRSQLEKVAAGILFQKNHTVSPDTLFVSQALGFGGTNVAAVLRATT